MQDAIRLINSHAAGHISTIRQAFRTRLSALDVKKSVQLAQMKALDGEVLQSTELMQQFGMTSSPPQNSQCIVVPLGGKAVHAVIIATENENFRVAVEQGETCIYNQWGAKITFKKEKDIEVECDNFTINAQKNVTINACDSITMKTKSLHEQSSVSAAYSSPALSFEGANGGTATAKMRANIEQEGWHTSTADQIAGNVSQMHHPHMCSQCGRTSEPVAG